MDGIKKVDHNKDKKKKSISPIKQNNIQEGNSKLKVSCMLK